MGSSSADGSGPLAGHETALDLRDPELGASTATTRSHESMISQPPARADPLTAAMIGLAKLR